MTPRRESTTAAPRRPIASSRRRLRWVWSLFAASMTTVGGVLLLLDGPAPQSVLATTAAMVRSPGAGRPDSVLPAAAPLDRARWRSIVIHHSGLPAGNAASIERFQQSAGISGLGYHFVVGNGHGSGDGEIEVGYRWAQQLPGAHVALRPKGTGASGSIAARQASFSAAELSEINERSIAICLVGNGDRSSFTPRQVRELVSLVRALQRELGIPASEVRLHRDLAEVTSPGERFPTAEFESQILP
ncbi:MAG: N-acetylmuramoyl-L-alanine amidase [Phycisphaeraceae bacterium]|nr:N-acetylmuramoyl-L-alanine amidase [Phycisphaeraceae bacterium]